MLPDKNPVTWGPHAWSFIFPIMIGYDNSRRAEYIQFLNSLASILPCTKCRAHYSQFLAMNPLTDSTNLLDWIIVVYNANTSRQKTKAEIIDYFSKLYNESKVLPIAIHKPKQKFRIIRSTPVITSTPISTVPKASIARHNPSRNTGYYSGRSQIGGVRRKGGCGCNR